MAVTCGVCGTDAYVTYDPSTNVAVCDGPGHPTDRMWEPARGLPSGQGPSRREGIAAEFGLYELLPELLVPGEWAETGVVEHRYGEANPDDYRWMVERWGHTAQGPRKYSVTSFIGSTLGDLTRDVGAVVCYRPGRGTGFFSYNSAVGYWTVAPTSKDMVEVSWENFATERGWDPRSWPLLGYHP